VFFPGDVAAARASLGLPLDRRVVLLPARLAFENEYKDAWMLEAAIDALRDLGVLGVAFGRVDREPREGLHLLAETVDESRVAEAHRAADVVVYPSRAETSPLAILEAFATARPVVATHVGGVPELVTEGRNGFLVDRGDAAGFVTAVRRVLEAPQLAAELGAAGLADVRERHDLERVAAAWLDWYRELGERFRARADADRSATSNRGTGLGRSRPARALRLPRNDREGR
jgi:glycosyltransferase involved in cell wall biosynthesis